MKLWIDTIKSAPIDYVWVKNIEDAKFVIENKERMAYSCSNQAYILECNNKFEMAQRIRRGVKDSIVELIDIDEYSICNGDYIKFLNWLKDTGRNYPIYFHE